MFCLIFVTRLYRKKSWAPSIISENLQYICTTIRHSAWRILYNNIRKISKIMLLNQIVIIRKTRNSCSILWILHRSYDRSTIGQLTVQRRAQNRSHDFWLWYFLRISYMSFSFLLFIYKILLFFKFSFVCFSWTCGRTVALFVPPDLLFITAQLFEDFNDFLLWIHNIRSLEFGVT